MKDDATVPENDHPLLAGRYRVVRRLGAGGMGEVFLVEDLKLGNSRFAVKMLPAWLGSHDQAAESLREEARLAIGLSHTNIVTTRAFDVLPSGQPYLVMDFVEGRTLAEVLKSEGRMACAEVQALFGPIAAALDYAHSKGVVHRDIKPSNIMIRSDGTPVIMDFGVAREVKEASVRVTGAAPSGTLCYMSPEQLRGEHPAPAQDVYGLAATMWECLFGEAPFARGDVATRIKEEQPVFPKAPADPEFGNRLLAALAKDPCERPRTAVGVFGGVDSPKPTPVGRAEDDRIGGDRGIGSTAADLLDLESEARGAIRAVEAMAAKHPSLDPSREAEIARVRDFMESARENKQAGMLDSSEAALRRVKNECRELLDSLGREIDVAAEAAARTAALRSELNSQMARILEEGQSLWIHLVNRKITREPQWVEFVKEVEQSRARIDSLVEMGDVGQALRHARRLGMRVDSVASSFYARVSASQVGRPPTSSRRGGSGDAESGGFFRSIGFLAGAFWRLPLIGKVVIVVAVLAVIGAVNGVIRSG